ncbi:hypothetical protein A3Q56_05302 [Intoshia linei]|uniref:Mediator of RNA polymerase II transcription subunit 30 n=1 Tax=Intoshia linei TaxID=1819745 RepID=A0A177AYA7_9BILA|nr:hypothetical protein A3Q56_05302 [Intoshia linei]
MNSILDLETCQFSDLEMEKLEKETNLLLISNYGNQAIRKLMSTLRDFYSFIKSMKPPSTPSSDGNMEERLFSVCRSTILVIEKIFKVLKHCMLKLENYKDPQSLNLDLPTNINEPHNYTETALIDELEENQKLKKTIKVINKEMKEYIGKLEKLSFDLNCTIDMIN